MPENRDAMNGKKILIVDDDQGFLTMIKTGLEPYSCEILTALSGEEGLVLAKEKNPDLILLDVILPGIKGREVCARLKEDQSTAAIPIVFLTVKDSPDDVKAEKEAGAIGHITKPVHIKDLIQEIESIF